jgi:peroxiredoxin
MIANSGRETVDDVFRRVRDLDVSLHEQLRTFAEAVKRDQPEFAAAVDRLIQRLRQYGAGQSAPQIGEPMPLFILPDETGQMVSLEELLNRGPVAMTFLRGHWCPYCRININALVKAHRELPAGGGEIVAIMPERQEFVAELKLKSKIPFPVLTDADNGYALSLNLTIWIGSEMQDMMEGRFDLPAFQGNSSWMLPIPATFVVGRDGLIRARFIDPDYRNRMMISEMLRAMRA